MRLAFWGGVIAWGSVIVALQYQANGGILLGIAMLALLLTLLTTAHIVLFTLRHAQGKHLSSPNHIVKIGDHAVLPIQSIVPHLSRRKMVVSLLKYAAVAAMACVGLPHKAVAACGDCAATYGGGWYDCITYYCNNLGQTCCPPGYPYLNHCDCTCYDGTGFDCNSYSSCQYCG